MYTPTRSVNFVSSSYKKPITIHSVDANNTSIFTPLDFPVLTHVNPIHCSINSYTEDTESSRYVINVCGIDIYGVLSHIVGTMSLQKLNILSASSESFSYQDTLVFDNKFIVESGNVYTDTWQKNIHKFILKQGMLIYAQKRSKALENILEHISTDYAKNAQAIAHPPIIDIHIKPLITENEFHTFEITIEGKDSPYLLYMLTSAFEQQKLNILSFSIKTHKSHVEDIFILQAIEKNSQIDERELRMKLMLTVQLTYYIRFAANPYKAMIRFQEILACSVFKNKHDDPCTLMIQNDEIPSFFAKILGSGDYLWEDFIRTNSEETIKTLADASHKKRKKDIGIHPAQYEYALRTKLHNISSFEEKITILNAFKDTQSYLIDLDVLLRYKKNFRELSYRLSELARVVIKQAAYIIYDRLVTLHDIPSTSEGIPVPWLLCGLGKFGGSALGYASDIEIMLIYNDADSIDTMSNKRFFENMIQLLCKNIYSKRNGIFHIDVRLRPYGSVGPLATRLDNFIEYYSENGKSHSIERLALCRMHPVAGSDAMTQRVCAIRDMLLYKPKSIQRKEIFTLRKNQLKLKVKPHTRNAKFSLGALVDVEYNIQILQVEYGINHIELRNPSIHNALLCLKEIGEISKKECAMMINSYDFFRTLINALRLRRGNALDLTLPQEESWELEHLARRMDYTNTEISAGRQLLADFDMHSKNTYNFIKQHLGLAAIPAYHCMCVFP